ncbi:unnamed protein product [Larinioides sclopetarius]|uniref:Uncharacterized protein n=1 Tax=Larinioides sclopetarius TaxID=280406 RepID=A0AAV1ZEV6_9ARAC
MRNGVHAPPPLRTRFRIRRYLPRDEGRKVNMDVISRNGTNRFCASPRIEMRGEECFSYSSLDSAPDRTFREFLLREIHAPGTVTVTVKVFMFGLVLLLFVPL